MTATATRKQCGFNYIMQDINFALASLIYIHFFTVLARLHREDGDGNEKVTFTMNKHFFRLCRDYYNSLKMSTVG